jgi:transcriptional antiterminator NusG
MSDDKNPTSETQQTPADTAAETPATPEAPAAAAAGDVPVAPEAPAAAGEPVAPPAAADAAATPPPAAPAEPEEEDEPVDWDAADLAQAEEVEEEEEPGEDEDAEAVVRARREAAEERLKATRSRAPGRAPVPAEKPAKAAKTKAAARAAEPPPPPEPIDPSQFKWFVVHTYSGYENKAKQGLEQRIKTNHLEHKFAEIVIPTESVVELKRGRKRTTSRKFFPGYILVKMVLDDETWHLVKNTPKVTSFLGEQDGRKPSPVTEHEIQELATQMTEGAAKPKPRVQFEEGENVRVIDGPFQNFSGIVEEVKPEKGKLKVHISIFGRPTPVELDFMQVEKA